MSISVCTRAPLTAPVNEQDLRWRALCQRDPAADGQFLYGVVTTGIYCRPSCPARKPLAKNVRFYADSVQAEADGLRPCRRCQPHALTSLNGSLARAVRVCRHLQNADSIPSLAQLAAAEGISASYLQRQFCQVVGVSPAQYARQLRAARLREQLQHGASVTAAVYGAGYSDSSRFYAEAEHILGMTPRQYRAQGDTVTIYFALANCSLGQVLVAQTAKGVCAILLGDDPQELLDDLQSRFPRAELKGADASFEQTVSQVLGLIESPAQGHALPLDMRGTAFQCKVWDALGRIQPGKTLSYSELAKAMNLPGAARAVANACAANPLAVAVPCHRVVRRDGGLSGYRWGVERKRELLQREGAAINLAIK
ncbi:bifunctional DNA-binding transcriptional regulator/O6-methylguanine-DNA methyltransferase Ada [Gilvimarinus sp. DA14]|uniref:bifunctional DNA-binding transcriptional regulator/O6-methylguanine-DNA methyltransferase Ada n=1 Tax=Gilvimarinus sp. DA14 TaxID=2956798 RepID=UPI0020B73332|nr:bifunctional DNA-binding transcriptional regulator/O6-methylguanine-DNA methyltransferase Ada [Gilvimarinus sp. DA14]UTF61603.1 bifunctional DNA-binding transcriptional regulator/O6-methylguanine-DNA methyltransferase Ada [Gilvimarinus sp. DA14]